MSACRNLGLGAGRKGIGAIIAALVLAATLAFDTGQAAAVDAQLAAPRPQPLHRQSVPGPVPARVLRVIDGDTLMVRARIWIGQEIEIKVRLAGVDAPELRGRCSRERRLAQEARDLVLAVIADGEVSLNAVQYGKFAGRVVARVETSAGVDLRIALLDAGLARPYGGKRRRGWCAAAASGD